MGFWKRKNERVAGRVFGVGSTQAAAIASLPAYVARCSLFCVLVPPGVHENGEVRDLHGWARRGWCKMEAFANCITSHGNRPIVVAQSSSDIVTYPVTMSRRALALTFNFF